MDFGWEAVHVAHQPRYCGQKAARLIPLARRHPWPAGEAGPYPTPAAIGVFPF